MIKYIFILLFAMQTSTAYANENFGLVIDDGQLHLSAFLNGMKNGEKLHLFRVLANRLLMLNKYRQEVYLNFECVSIEEYGNYHYINFGLPEHHNELMKAGIVMKVVDKKFDIKALLKLLHFAISNEHKVKNELKSYRIKTYHGEDTFKSVSLKLLDSVIQSNDTVIDQLMNEKIYREAVVENAPSNKDYYWGYLYRKAQFGEKIDKTYNYFFQNNEYSFFEEVSLDQEYPNDSIQENIYFKTKDFTEIAFYYKGKHKSKQGQFIFSNDSTFYFIRNTGEPVKGPYMIESLPGYESIENINMDQRHNLNGPGLPKYILTFTQDRGDYTKVLFIPDSNLLIADYQKYEDELVENLLKKKNRKDQNPNAIYYVVLGMLCVIIVLLSVRKKV